MADSQQKTWSELVDPIAARFEVAAAFNVDAVHNSTGAAAVAELLRDMARIIDAEIERRET